MRGHPTKHDMACALSNKCIRMDFSGYPECAVPQSLVADLSGLDGTWWFTLYNGSDNTFDAQQSCRKVVFSTPSGQVLIGDYTVPLTYKKKTKICGEKGTYNLLPSGAVEVDHDSMPGYYLEHWYLVHKSKNTLLAKVCIAAENSASSDLRSYATIVLTRAPLSMLDPAEVQSLDQASQQGLGLALSAYKTADNSACINN